MRLILIASLFLSGCAYNSITINADGASKIYCTGSVEKPVDINTKATIPLVP